MREDGPSITAFAAAAHRAAHQLLEDGRILKDPLAVPITGWPPERLIEEAQTDMWKQGMRFFITARSAFAEAALQQAVEERGFTQLVLLGAGLDTFAYRNPHGDRLRIFEVDHPATQTWKRGRLAEAAIGVPGWVTYVPVNFESQSFVERLAESGFDPGERTFFFWLGVIPYLTEEAISGTFRSVADLPGGAEIAFDYGEPPDTLNEDLQRMHRERAERVAAIGEPFISHFTGEQMDALVKDEGLEIVEDLGLRAMAERFAPQAAPFMPEGGAHVALARAV